MWMIHPDIFVSGLFYPNKTHQAESKPVFSRSKLWRQLMIGRYRGSAKYLQSWKNHCNRLLLYILIEN